MAENEISLPHPLKIKTAQTLSVTVILVHPLDSTHTEKSRHPCPVYI
jgi:hypothetical protein